MTAAAPHSPASLAASWPRRVTVAATPTKRSPVGRTRPRPSRANLRWSDRSRTSRLWNRGEARLTPPFASVWRCSSPWTTAWGTIVETLERLGKLENTVVVVTSDHGYFYGEHGLGGERRLAYEETSRIPMLIRYPELIEAGHRVDDLVLCLDLASTLLELGDTEPARPLHGRSLVPLLNGDTPDDWRTSFLIEYYSDTVFRRIVTMGYKALRTERYKYIHYLELDGMDELYDLENDPYETKNIIDDPASETILETLRTELQRQLDETT